jgi:hypothetical protein
MGIWLAIHLLRAAIIVALGLLVSGCAGGLQSAPQVTHTVDRSVFYEAPDCVAIHSSGDAHPTLVRVVEPALERHLAPLFGHVMDGNQVWEFTGAYGLNLDDPEDWQRFGEAADCNTIVRWAAPEATSEFAGIWARQRLVLQIELVRASDGRSLWMATSATERSDGGLPFTPVAAIVGAVRASNLQANSQILPSMVDDVLRQAFATLPPMGPPTILN